eukprot:CAMPEP_0168423694 /NCGR_PEP_ID=MMETSP0228-20121227/34440_1 /TAXON_ID=133427 /ORGANISM="Protoceratium reticulatum, Strain CCCM 535 (=CCMP 1889)" /LENGTH=69 /DNA_ID=CAMNT_0008437663 /DNA_START=90 /DNA_END=296 /DNA_ORIENTATION=-
MATPPAMRMRFEPSSLRSLAASGLAGRASGPVKTGGFAVAGSGAGSGGASDLGACVGTGEPAAAAEAVG